MHSSDWPFADPPNVAVFTTKSIINGDSWIAYVSHEAEDGAWQFHPPNSSGDEEDAAIVALHTILRLDASVGLLRDLPLGWFAWREHPASEWQRGNKRM